MYEKIFEKGFFYKPLELPTWITFPSGQSRYVKNKEDLEFWVGVARDDYLRYKDDPSKSAKSKETYAENYQWIKKFQEDFPKRKIVQKERPKERVSFPVEFAAPSGHKYVFKNWQELKNLENPTEMAKVLEYEFTHDKRNRSKEQIAQELQKDILFLRNKRDEIQETGHVEESESWAKNLTEREYREEIRRRNREKEEKEARERQEQYKRDEEEASRFNDLRYEMQDLLNKTDITPQAAAASSPMAAPEATASSQAPKKNPKEEEEDVMFPIKIVAPNLETGEMQEYIFNTPKEYTNIGDKVLRKLDEKLPREEKDRYAKFLEAYIQGMKEAEEREKTQIRKTQTTNTPPEATAAPQQATVETPIAGAPPKATAAPEIPKTRENFYGINEPNFPMNVLFPDDIKVVQRNLSVENKADYERIINKLNEGIQKARYTGDLGAIENYSKALKHVESTYNQALNERREKETPAYVRNPDGSVIDTRTHEVVDPERIRLAAAQERSSQIAGQPFKRNPYEAFPSEQNPLLRRGIEAVEDELHRQNAPQLKASQEFKYPEQSPQQKLAAAMYMNPDRGRHGFETLRDSILEQSRQRAIRRLNQSFEDLGRQYSANRMGRNSLFEAQKGRMMKDVMEDLNLLDHETELKLRAMNEQQLGGRAQFSQGQYESEAQRALEQYKMNQQRKEQELARRRQAASDAIAAGTLRQNLTEQNRARQSAEFMREQNFPREQLRSHLDELRASTLGMPAMPQEERRNVPAPRLVPQVAPPALEREIAATAGAPPSQPPAPPADTTFRDVSGAVLGGLGLKLQYDKFKADEAARQAGKT